MSSRQPASTALPFNSAVSCLRTRVAPRARFFVHLYCILPVVDELRLERAKEALDRRIVIAVAFADHRRREATHCISWD